MRLIDADALADVLGIAEDCQDCQYKNGMFCKKSSDFVGACEAIYDAPTIEAEWIPVSERLPFAEYGESDNVLATCGYRGVGDTNNIRWVKTLYFNGGTWCYPTGETYDQKVYAWMPMPEPWKGEQ